MAKEDWEIAYETDDGDAVLIHDTDHGNSGTHEVPHAHDVNIPKGEDEDYLDTGRSLTDDEKDYYNDYKK